MPTNAIKAAVQKLQESGLAALSEIRGSTAEEISKLEAHVGVRLPSAYRSFLRVMGEGAGGFLIGTDWTLPNLFSFKASAKRLLEENNIEASLLSTTMFVFAMHQGYQFLFFDCAGSADPPVFLFLDGEPGPRQVFGSFSDWLVRCVDDEIAIYRKLRR
jgi:hypothetical protein